MSFEFLDPIINLLPEVERPKTTPSIKEKISWVVAGLLIFFILGQIAPFGILSDNYCAANPSTPGCQRLGFLSNVQTILAANIGTLATLGIGPIVMASIILQLLSGAEIIKIEKERYQGMQKLAAVLFCFFEGAIYVYSNFLPIQPSNISLLPLPILGPYFELYKILVIFQIAMGSIILLYLDEIISKWGFGSGIGLFIVGGVAQSIMWGALSIWTQGGQFIGAIPQFIVGFIQGGLLDFNLLAPVIFTGVVFLIVVYVESMRVEIPLTLGRVRGIGGRYPLKFLYASNLPVILAAALFANMQLFANVAVGMDAPVIGTFTTEGSNVGQPLPILNLDHGNLNLPPQFVNRTDIKNGYGITNITIPLAYMVKAPYGQLGTTTAIEQNFLNPTYTVYTLIQWEPLKAIPLAVVHILVYTILLIIACIIFGKFWIETTGMSASKVAEQLRNVGFSVPGFRRDVRVMEKVLNRYIPVITVLGSATVGLLAAGADLTGALGSGTGILLSVGILYRLYEQLAQSQLMEMHPALKSFMGGE